MELDKVIALINSDEGKELPLSSLEKGVPEVMSDSRPAIKKALVSKETSSKDRQPSWGGKCLFYSRELCFASTPFSEQHTKRNWRN